MSRKAQNAARLQAEKEARETLAQLEMLDYQREDLVQELKEAKVNIVKVNPPTEEEMAFSAIAALPENPRDEIKTLVKVANAVINSEASIEEEIKDDLEIEILDDIKKVAQEVEIIEESYSDEEFYDKIIEIQGKNEGLRLKDFLHENDIMMSDDPYSEFLRKQM